MSPITHFHRLNNLSEGLLYDAFVCNKELLVVNLYIPHNRRTSLQAEEALCPISIPWGWLLLEDKHQSIKIFNNMAAKLEIN
jgi:hypothetical protein